MPMRSLKTLICVLLGTLAVPLNAIAQQSPTWYLNEQLCDTKFQDCREQILELIRHEQVGIDVAFWFMEDGRYVTELVKRHNEGLPIRILVDQRANATKRLNETMVNALRDGGIPMREKYVGDILHFKMFLFHGQNMVNFSKANFSPSEYVPDVPNSNYSDEAVFYTHDNSITNSFRRRFDDLWMDQGYYRNFANMTGPPQRSYPVFGIDPAMNFPPGDDFSNRSVARYNAETQKIDVVVFRVTDHRQADAMINAVARGVTVRLITDPDEYRNPKRVYDSKHVDRMYMGGVQIKIRKHEGITHQASVVMHGLGEVIFGSSNWTTASANWQDEHNYFYNPTLGKPWFFQWFKDQFESKWTDTVNYATFQPLPPTSPTYASPANLASGQPTSVTLSWDGGTWSHLYDIYFGSTPNPPLVASNQEIGNPEPGVMESFTVSNLTPGTTYYWRIVGKTWAQMTNSGPTWSFATAGTAPQGTTPAYGGTPAAVPGTIQAENFDEGGQAVAYVDTTTGNSGGAYRQTDVDIEASTDTGGGFNLSKTRAGEWLKYTVNVATTGTYTLETRVANIGTGATFRVEVDGVDQTGLIPVPDTGGWQTWQTITKTGLSLTAGTRVLRVVLVAAGSGGGVGNLNWFKLVSASAPPPPPPTDVCPNIDGVQTSVPPGMVLENGQCVTPTPPPPTDVCPNIAGVQTTVPPGMVLVNGQCVTPPPPPSSTPYGGVAAALPGLVQVENFDNGGEGLAYHDASANNSGNTYRTTDVDLGPTADPSSGGYYLGWTRETEWLKYTVNATVTRSYVATARVANVGAGAKFRIEVDGVDVTGPISVPDTGGWDIWQTIPLGNIPLTQGQRVIRLVMLTRNVENTGVGNFGYLSFQ
jgi:hypothetical protein